MEYINTHQITPTPNTITSVTTEGHQMVANIPDPLVNPGTFESVMMISDESVLKKTVFYSQLQTVGSVVGTDSQYISEGLSSLKSGQNPVTDTLCEELDWDLTDFLKSTEVELNRRPQQHAFVIGNTTNVTSSDHPNEVVTHRVAQLDYDLVDNGDNFGDLMSFVEGDTKGNGTVFDELMDSSQDTEVFRNTSSEYQQNPTEDDKGAILLGDQLILQAYQRCQSVDLHASQVLSDTDIQEQHTNQQTSDMCFGGNNLVALGAEDPLVQNVRWAESTNNACYSPQESDFATVPIDSTSHYNNSLMSNKDHTYVQVPTYSDPGLSDDSNQSHSAVGNLENELTDNDILPVAPTTPPLTTVNLKAFNGLLNNTVALDEESSTRSDGESYCGDSFYDGTSCPASSPDIPSPVHALAESVDEDTSLYFESGPDKGGNVTTMYNERVPAPCKENSILQFLRSCLRDPTCGHLIKWISESDGHFQIDKKNKDELAKRWFSRKDSASKAKYGYFTRAMRYYYKKKMLKRIDGKKLQYQFLTS